jgi:hypothetical protein
VLHDGFPAFLAVDPIYFQALRFIPRFQFIERRTFFPAIGSPGGPEIEKDDFSQLILNTDRLSIQVFKDYFRKGQWFGIGMKDRLLSQGLRPLPSDDPYQKNAKKKETPMGLHHLSPVSFRFARAITQNTC